MRLVSIWFGQFRKACEACGDLHTQQCASRVFKCVAPPLLWLEKLGVESCGCVILVDESYVISSAASTALHIFVMLWCGKAVSNGVRAASLPNVDFQLRGRSPML